MIRRGLSICCACVALILVAVPGAQAETPPGPRLAITTLSLESFKATLFTAGADGTQPATLVQVSLQPLLSEPLPAGAATWSPDGQTLVFPGITRARSAARTSRPREMLFAMSVGGGEPRALAGTTGGEAPVFSPDGHTIAFARQKTKPRSRQPGRRHESAFKAASTWLTDIAGGPARQITQWRNGLEIIPSSFSPDGLGLALTRTTSGSGSEAVVLRLDTGLETVLARNALEPVYSPDGSRIALLRPRGQRLARGSQTKAADLVVIQADGSGEVRLTEAAKGAALWPRWDPSGQRIAFIRLDRRTHSAGELLALDTSVFEINADGTCPTQVFSAPHVLYAGAVWQPGAGREAAPLSC